MTVDRVAVAVVALAILALTLATGPVGLFEVGTGNSNGLEEPGTGTATVEVVSEPETVALVDSQDGQDLLHLEVQATTVEVSNVTGNPILSYTVALEEIGVAIDSATFVGQGEEDTLELAIDRRIFQPHEVTDVSEADLSLTMRGDSQTTLFEKTVTVDRSD